VDLIEPQMLLSVWADDLKRLYGLQIDKVLAFSGSGTITDERYAQFRAGGYIDMENGASVTDLTPKIPPEALPLLQWLQDVINQIAGFPPIMQGQGDAGVARAYSSIPCSRRPHPPSAIARCWSSASWLTRPTCRSGFSGPRTQILLDRWLDAGEGRGDQIPARRNPRRLPGHGRQPLVEPDLLGRGDAADLPGPQDRAVDGEYMIRQPAVPEQGIALAAPRQERPQAKQQDQRGASGKSPADARRHSGQDSGEAARRK
jgi:hypothetical protein